MGLISLTWVFCFNVAKTSIRADILYNLNAIYKTIHAFDANETRLESKTLTEILSIPCFMLF